MVEKETSSRPSGLVYALQLQVNSAAGVFVILAGVRLILGEIVPALKVFQSVLYLIQNLLWIVRIVYTMHPMQF